MLSGMPYLGMLIFSLIVSAVGDKLRHSGTVSTSVVRKVANTIGKIMQFNYNYYYYFYFLFRSFLKTNLPESLSLKTDCLDYY